MNEKDLIEKIREHLIKQDKVSDWNSIKDKEAAWLKVVLIFNRVNKGLTESFYQIQASKFLTEIEELNKDKPKWQTKNHTPILYNSLNEFYNWLKINYWNKLKENEDMGN